MPFRAPPFVRSNESSLFAAIGCRCRPCAGDYAAGGPGGEANPHRKGPVFSGLCPIDGYKSVPIMAADICCSGRQQPMGCDLLTLRTNAKPFRAPVAALRLVHMGAACGPIPVVRRIPRFC